MSTVTGTRCDVFDRVLCAVDGSEQSLEAVRQARALRNPLGWIHAVSVYDPPVVIGTPYGAPAIISETELGAEHVVEQAREALPEGTAQLLHGPTVSRLNGRLRGSGATLVAVGAKGRGRRFGIVTGSVTTALLHRSPVSVLVARDHWDGEGPRRIVVGVDGSEGSLAALRAAHDLARRAEAELRVVVAEDAVTPDLPVAVDAIERDPGHAVDVLRRASKDADLLVVGSRGLKGLKALGSVSERIGHTAACSVLVVRPPAA